MPRTKPRTSRCSTSRCARPAASTGKQALTRAVAQHPFFKGLPAAYVNVLVACASQDAYPTGHVIFREGDVADTFYALQDGVVSVEITEAGSSGVPIQRLGKGEVLGWSWLVPPYQKRFAARVLEPVHALVFDAACLRRQCARNPALGYAVLERFIRVLGARLQATRLQLLDVYNIPH